MNLSELTQAELVDLIQKASAELAARMAQPETQRIRHERPVIVMREPPESGSAPQRSPPNIPSGRHDSGCREAAALESGGGSVSSTRWAERRSANRIDKARQVAGFMLPARQMSDC